jgi:anti-sigma regulatory factor (Ser/Thr protein kinase)
MTPAPDGTLPSPRARVDLWARRPRPRTTGTVTSTAWRATPTAPGELYTLRRQVRDLLDADPRSSDDDADRLLLAFEELASNALRHGRLPVLTVVTLTADGWLLEVSDEAGDRPPAPDHDRDPADGGLGLHLVAQLCDAHGWTAAAGRKTAWAQAAWAAPAGAPHVAVHSDCGQAR